MKYTNKHIKEEYKLNQIGRTIGMILLVIGILLVGFGMIQTKRKMDYVRPFELVLQEESNPANQTAYIDIIRVPEKLAENKYEGYYLVTTAEESYIVEMQPEQFVDLKQRVEENGKSINCQTKAGRILRGYIRTPKKVCSYGAQIHKGTCNNQIHAG